MTKKYYKVTTKCGYIGKNYIVKIDFPICASSEKEVIGSIKYYPEVKCNHLIEIIKIQETTKKEYNKLKRKNLKDSDIKRLSKQSKMFRKKDMSKERIKYEDYLCDIA